MSDIHNELPDDAKPAPRAKGFHWSRMMAGILATLDAAKDRVGKILNPMPRAPHLETVDDLFRPRPDFHQRPKRRRGYSAKSPGADRRPGPPRLGRPRGPGTIHARADGLALAREGRWAEAAVMLYQVDTELSVKYERWAADTSLVELGYRYRLVA